jgi:diguanylate cyclase (GGDEF)-like protein
VNAERHAEQVRTISLRLRPRVALPVGRSLVIGIVGGSLFVAGLIVALLGVWSIPAPKPEPWWVALVIGGCFIAGEQLMLHVEYRREALTLTLTEVPTALCLMFLDLRTALLVRVATSVIVFMLVIGQRYVKVLYNLGLQVFSLATGFTVFHALVDGKEWSEVGFVWLFLAVSMITVIDAVLVIVAIGVFEGHFLEKLREEVRNGAPRVFIASVTATLATGLAVAWPVLAFSLLLPVIGVWKVLRTNVQTTQRLRDLVDVNGLMASLGVTLERDELARIAVVETQRLLRAERVALLTCEPTTGTLTVAASVGEPLHGLPVDGVDEHWRDVLDGRQAVLLDSETVASFDLHGGNAIVAPVYDDDELVAVLVVSDRHGAAAHFDDADLVRAGTIADRLALALRNAVLHEQLQHEAWHDGLTGLPNRIQFERTIDEVLDAGDPTGTIGLLMFGVDRFREVNSTLGHQVGDRVLLELVARLDSGLGTGDVLARLAGDEFGILLRVDGEAQLLDRARQLVDVAERRLVLDDFEVVVTLSVGAVLCPDRASNAAVMLRRADIAMHAAKLTHSSVELYRNDIDRRTPERLSMLGDLKVALEHSHLEVNFQPKVDLASGRVVGAEALVRWNHPQRGMVPPVEFVSLAENTGLITMLTDQVLRKCVSTIRLLNDLGHHLDLSLNLSAIDLLDDKLVGRVERILAENGVAADQLTLEITESALLADGPRSLETAEGLRRLGAHLSIDDFGTGFSSFSYLRVLPASELKVDQSFVTNMLSDERDEVIVRSTIDLGHNLGLRVVAEGVEDMATLERLRVLGCDLVQGFGIAKPMPLERLLVFLNGGAHDNTRPAGQAAAPTPFQPRVVSAS